MNRPLTILLFALTGCTSLDPATLIARDRVLGAKVTVDSDPQRAWPNPGESATMTWLTASPGPAPMFSWILAACPAATSSGLPICAGPVFAASQATGLVPVLQLAIPADITADSVAVLGGICASGTPVIDEQTHTASCDDGSQADAVSQHIFIASDAVTNHNPNLVDAPFTIAGMTWDRGGEPGCGEASPVIAAGSGKTLVGVTFEGSDRETFAVPGDPTPSREELQLSEFATAGKIKQEYTFVESDDAREVSPVAFEWTPPAASEVPADGLPVTFNFVVRDRRGGVDATTRELCVR